MFKITKLLSKPLFYSLTFFVLTIILVTITLIFVANSNKKDFVYEKTIAIKSGIFNSLNSRLILWQSIGEYLKISPNLSEEEFTKFISSIFHNDIYASSIHYTKFNNSEINYNFPKNNNQNLKLIEKFNEKFQKNNSEKSCKSCIHGPLNFISENPNLIISIPVNSTKNINEKAGNNEEKVAKKADEIGVLNVILCWNKILDEIEIPKEIKITLTNICNCESSDSIIYEDSATFNSKNFNLTQNEITTSIDFPENKLLLSAYSEINILQSMPPFYGFFYGAALYISLIIYFIAKYSINFIKKNELKYKMIADNSRDAFWILDAETMQFTFVSDAITEVSGFTAEETLEIDFYSRLNSKTTKLVNEILFDLAKQFQINKKEIQNTIVEIQIKHKKGNWVWVEISASLVFDKKGNIREILGIMHRIDNKKKEELRMSRKQKELQELNLTKDKFFTIISHDLRNPFAALLSMSEVLTNHNNKMSQNELQKNINFINTTANHIYSLLEDLLQWSQTTRGVMQFSPEVHNLTEIMYDSINNLKIQAKEKNIEIILPDILEEYFAMCDSNMIKTIIRNLVSNAIKFSHPNSMIILNVKENEGKYIISVKDSGVGIDEEKQKKLFLINENISTKGTNNERGTGLGLVLCKEFTNKHNSNFWLKSKIGEGTTIYFSLIKHQCK
jgi:PAS domain S-box-containing protein